MAAVQTGDHGCLRIAGLYVTVRLVFSLTTFWGLGHAAVSLSAPEGTPGQAYDGPAGVVASGPHNASVASRRARALTDDSIGDEFAASLQRALLLCSHKPDCFECTGQCSYMYCGSQFRNLVSACALRQSRRATQGHYRLLAMASTADDGAQKRPRAVKIGTHSGSFHCDEALGCYLLRKTAQFEGAPITRRFDLYTQLVLNSTASYILNCAGAAGCASPSPGTAVVAHVSLRTCFSEAEDTCCSQGSSASACSP